MDGNNPMTEPDDVPESVSHNPEQEDINIHGPYQTHRGSNQNVTESLLISSSLTDDVNPVPGLSTDPLRGMPPPRHTNPNGMLMGPDDPFFKETQNNPRTRGVGQVRYDVIGPFGQEPDPNIDIPPGSNPFPNIRGGFPSFGPGRFGGPGGGSFGGFFP
ncbi:hypothetical protein BBOV_III005710 [Babesia bovis T2Bo]|uniref:Uncharacterized protein n=1 Tax=Babesia bovis TaxID=5865 RepID=A7ANK0_BABBO|nr:hypothetical protein BBOV_III005710 [Babesia bovis T2Bo]EDO08134.1 hypothetical protein BBOV_III005710 [Babesia bovis T2Bo]|eukprot:XP_001611702.1 hypothetical protein [Babesia bovis T2Bo]